MTVRRIDASVFFAFITLLPIIFSLTSNQAFCQHEGNISEQTRTVKSTYGKMAGFAVSNRGDSIANFTFTVNNRIWFSPDEMIKYICNMKIDILPGTGQHISSAFSFVVNYSGHRSEIPLANEFAFSPGYFMNSLGYGLCSNRAAVLANILIELGYRSRCVQLGGHLVCEVLEDGSWKMLDPDYGSYFLINNRLASVKEISTKHKECTPVFNGGLISDVTALMPESYIALFTSSENNSIDSYYTTDIIWDKTSISLPPGAVFKTPIEVTNINENAEKSVFAYLQINEPFDGIIEIPFVIYKLNGNITHFIPVCEKNHEILSEFYSPPGKYRLKCEDARIYMYINPILLETGASRTEISVKSSNLSSLEVSKLKLKKRNKGDLWLEEYEEDMNSSLAEYKYDFLSAPGNFDDTLNISSPEDFKNSISDFYSKTHNGECVPVSILDKTDKTLLLLKKYNFDTSKFLFTMQYPFLRNAISILIIELPVDAIEETFDYFPVKMWY